MSTKRGARRPSAVARKQPPPPCPFDVPFVASPGPVIERMLRLADVGPNDLVYDLGCGDGRLLVAAARRGARAVGIEVDPRRVRDARRLARAERLEQRITVRRGNLFHTSAADATVVVLFLLPHVLQRLVPRLRRLRPGTRLVSHAFPLEGLKPARVVEVRRKNRFNRMIYCYVLPEA